MSKESTKTPKFSDVIKDKLNDKQAEEESDKVVKNLDNLAAEKINSLDS